MEAHGEGMPAHAHGHGEAAREHVHAHEELGVLRKYVFSTDHKTIGIQYTVTGLGFLFFGFCLMMLMRWQLAYPGTSIPVIGKILQNVLGPGALTNDGTGHPGLMTPEFYNSLGAMHGTIMIFLGI